MKNRIQHALRSYQAERCQHDYNVLHDLVASYLADLCAQLKAHPIDGAERVAKRLLGITDGQD